MSRKTDMIVEKLSDKIDMEKAEKVELMKDNKDVLDKGYYGTYCMCCGRKVEKIWKFLLKQPIKANDVSEWKGHNRYKDSNHFYDTGKCDYCEECGKELDDEELHSVWESRGEFWGAPCSEQMLVGYKCGSCGFENKF